MECLTRQTVKTSSVTTTAAPVTSTTPLAATAPEQAPNAAAATVAATAPTSTSATSTPTTATAATATATPCTPNVVTIPVPIVSQEEIYTYVSVKGSLHDRCCALFGLNEAEVLALSKRFENGPTQIVNGVMVCASPMQLINTLSQLGYKVICSTGEAEIVWTMQREV